jgi:hypothetical protein
MFVGREAFERLEALGEVVSLGEVGEVAAKRVVSLVAEPPDNGVLDRAVHALDLSRSASRQLSAGSAIFPTEV